MKQLLYILTFLFVGNQLYAQFGMLPHPRDVSNTTAIDSGSIRIIYAMNAVDINDTKTYDDIQRLEIGSKLSKYYSYYLYRNDSLVEEWGKKNKGAAVVPTRLGEFGKTGNVWSLVIWSDYFKDFSKNVLTEYAIMPRGRIPPLQYTEEIPVQEWELQEDTLTVCGYLCQKATCRFRGNNFVAWFTPDIPVSNGPWKFGGLPGLILKVFDNEMYYVFECIQIESHEKKYPIIMLNEKRYQKTERTKLRKLEKDLHEDFNKVTGWTRDDGRKSEPIPYHPLELE